MHAGLLRDVLSLLLGFLTVVLSALFGIGGAIVSNPGLRALGAAPLVAVGTTLPSILPGAVSGTLRYRREGLIDWRLITPAAAAGLLAVVGGSLLSHAVPGEGHLLLLIIALLLAFTAWRTAFTRGVEDDPSSPAGAVDNPAHLDPRPALHRPRLERVRLRSPSGGPRSGGAGCRAPTPRDQGPRGPRLGSVGSRPGSAWLPGCCRGCWGSGVGWSWCRPSASCCRCR